MHTWVPGLTVGAEIIPRHVVHEILQDLLIARLLALTYEARHDRVRVWVRLRLASGASLGGDGC